jgi:predicted alpha-1,2-mannosidase
VISAAVQQERAGGHTEVPTMTPPLRRLLLALSVLGLLAGAVPVAAAAPATSEDTDLARWVDPMIGTAPVGFVFPGAVRPYGMVQVSPDTEGPFAYSGYLATDQTIRGFSMVHLSGPGVPKGGDLPFMPTVGPVLSGSAFEYASPFNHATESAAPGDYRVLLEKSATQVELTATDRVGLQRYTFPASPQSNVLIDVSRSAEQNQSGSPFGLRQGHVRIVGDDEVEGWTRGRYPVHFVAKFSRPFTAHGTWHNDTLTPGSDERTGTGVGGWVSFDTTAQREVTMKVGISFVDIDGARRNLDAEMPGWDFDAVRSDARAAWNRELSRIRVDGGTELDRTAFYTALYHASLHPNVFNDVDGRYRGFDDAIHTVTGRLQYANFASWDTYKAHNQLTATLSPHRYRDMVASQLDNYRKSGKIPRFGEQSIDANHMSGDPAIPMIVDGFCRGALDDLPAADIAELYRAMTELATEHRPQPLRELGWLPDRPGTTLEYGGADFALALMADELGLAADADRWLEQSLNYRNILDPETLWIRPRNAEGQWRTPFAPTDEDGFQEGNSWQYSWLAPHDARGLFDGMGGDAVATERLDDLFDHDLAATVPVAVAEVHNRLNVFGLVYRTATYAPGNEHDLQVPWMYPFAGQPWKTQAVHRQIQGVFRATPDGLPGNDDLGGLSAWHVWSALGFGPVTPGAPFYVVGAPQFERAEIALPGGRSFVLEAPGASLLGKYVRSATLDGKPLDSAWFFHDAVAAGKTLRLQMGTTPNTAWGTATAPPSATDTPLSGFGCRGI